MKFFYSSLLTVGTALALSSCLKEDINPAAGTPASYAAINVVRDIYKGSEITLNPNHLSGATQISGVVISDKTAGNIKPGSFIIQGTKVTANQAGDVTRGLVLDMGDNTEVPYVLGDSIMIQVTGARLNRINGALTLSGISADKVSKLAENRKPLARPVTLAMLNYDFGAYESTVVSVHADVNNHTAGATISGDHLLNDNTGGAAYLQTRSGAAFANETLPVNAQFTGVAAYYNDKGNDTTGAQKVIRLRNTGDVAFSSGMLYAGFPESFEAPELSQKSSYNMTATANNIDLSTGNWKLQQAILANTVLRDKYNLPGKQNVRLQQNLSTSAYVQMNFDVMEGASKVTVFYGKYYTDPVSTFRLEYSTNGGTTWTAVPGNISDMPERGSKQATFMVNIQQPVRFRIHKLGLGTSSSTIQNGRLSIEDFAIYKAQ